MVWWTLMLERLDMSITNYGAWSRKKRHSKLKIKKKGPVRLNDGTKWAVKKWPFSLIIRLIEPIKFVMAKCQSLRGICNHDSRRLPHTFGRAFVQMSFPIVLSFPFFGMMSIQVSDATLMLSAQIWYFLIQCCMKQDLIFSGMSKRKPVFQKKKVWPPLSRGSKVTQEDVILKIEKIINSVMFIGLSMSPFDMQFEVRLDWVSFKSIPPSTSLCPGCWKNSLKCSSLFLDPLLSGPLIYTLDADSNASQPALNTKKEERR